MRLFLVRHGQTDWNRRGVAQGHTDTDLDALGHAQAGMLVSAFSDVRLKSIFSSDLKRCVQTATPLANRQEIELTTSTALRERTFGELEGTPFRNLGAWFATECERTGLPEHLVSIPGGESWQGVWDRLDTVLPEITSCGGDVAVVSHGGTCRLLLAKLLRAGIESVHSFRFWNTSVTELERADGVWKLVRYNDTKHLEVVDEGQTA